MYLFIEVDSELHKPYENKRYGGILSGGLMEVTIRPDAGPSVCVEVTEDFVLNFAPEEVARMVAALELGR